MKNSQAGYTIVEALAYLAIYGVIGAAVLTGAGVVMQEMRVKKDLAAIMDVEKEIRSISVILDNFDVAAAPSEINGGVDNLQDFLCNKKIIWCNSVPSGKVMKINGSGVEKVGESCAVPYSFSITVEGLSAFECTKYWDWVWGDTALLKKTGSKYNLNTNDCEYEQKNAGTVCENNQDFTVYFR